MLLLSSASYSGQMYYLIQKYIVPFFRSCDGKKVSIGINSGLLVYSCKYNTEVNSEAEADNLVMQDDLFEV